MCNFLMLLRWLAVSMLLVGLLGGCATWRYVPPEKIAPTIRDVGPSKVRVVTADGSTVEVAHPSIVNDSLVGKIGPNKKQRTSFALGSIDSLSVRGTNHTAGWALAGVSLVLIVAFLASIETPAIP